MKNGDVLYDWRNNRNIEIIEMRPAGYPHSALCFCYEEREARFGTNEYLGIESDLAEMDRV